MYFCHMLIYNQLLQIQHFQEDKIDSTKQGPPTMIAIESENPAIRKYKLSLEFITIDLPTGSSFFDSIDYLIKSFFVFNLQFPLMLNEFYTFIVCKIYNIKQYDIPRFDGENDVSKPILSSRSMTLFDDILKIIEDDFHNPNFDIM